MVLIIAPEDDVHALVVGQRLARIGRPYKVWDPTWFPLSQQISWRSGGAVKVRANVTFDWREVECVWRRRVPLPALSPLLTGADVRRFCDSECRDLVNGLLASHPATVNDPTREREACLKVRQLWLAERNGLTVPRTIISNDAGAIRSFLRTERRAVYKTLRNDFTQSVLTKECDASTFSDEGVVSYAPTIVQELVEAVADVRVVVVGREVFAGELVRADINSEVDWRLTATGWRRHALPCSVASALLRLVQELGLDTASIDMRKTLTGQYVFLELNPGGQFLFLEVDAGIPLSAAFASYLAEAGKRSSPTVKPRLEGSHDERV